MIITGFYASIMALFMLTLAFWVVYNRIKFRIGLLDEGNITLRRAIRIHGNTIEYVPLLFILMAISETNGMATYYLHCLGILLILSRLYHAWGLAHSSGYSIGRRVGIIGTWVIIIIYAVYNISAFINLLFTNNS